MDLYILFIIFIINRYLYYNNFNFKFIKNICLVYVKFDWTTCSWLACVHTALPTTSIPITFYVMVKFKLWNQRIQNNSINSYTPSDAIMMTTKYMLYKTWMRTNNNKNFFEKENRSLTISTSQLNAIARVRCLHGLLTNR